MDEIQLMITAWSEKTPKLAIEKGLAEATWYASPIPKAKLRELLQRRDGPAFATRLSGFLASSVRASGASFGGVALGRLFHSRFTA